jgi:hypothetical protein
MCDPSLAWGCFTSWSWTTTNDLSCNHHSNRFRDIKIWYPWSSKASSSVPCWECLARDGGDDARRRNGGFASCSRDLAPLDFLLSKLYYFSPRTGRRGEIIFDERRFINNTTGNSKHTCCPLNKFKPSSLSRVPCGYVRRYHSVYVWSYFLQSVIFFFLSAISITHWYSFCVNRCITDAVIKTSRCPVCMTPTLLYCLFRLDLAAWILLRHATSSCFSHKFKFLSSGPIDNEHAVVIVNFGTPVK